MTLFTMEGQEVRCMIIPGLISLFLSFSLCVSTILLWFSLCMAVGETSVGQDIKCM